MNAMPPADFTAELRAAAQDEQLNKALAALHCAAGAAGIPDAQPGSIAEVGALIAASYANLRRELDERTRQGNRADRAIVALREKAIAALSTSQHSMTISGGLPFCTCGLSLAGGRASETFVDHVLPLHAWVAGAADRIRALCRDETIVWGGPNGNESAYVADVLAALDGQHG
jgi:hypothetical protein